MNKNIRIKYLLLLFLMLLGNNAWGQNAQEEKLLYSTDFTEWNDINRKTATDTEVKKKTEGSNEEFTFTFNGVGVDPKGTKISNYTGYMITAKYPGEYSKSEPSAVTSPLRTVKDWRKVAVI